MCNVHCWFYYNCDSCTTGAPYNFCSGNMDYGNSIRLLFCFEFVDFLQVCITFCCWLTILPSVTAFLLYVASVIVLVFVLVFHFSPQCGHSNILVFTGICSLMGSLSVSNLIIDGTYFNIFYCKFKYVDGAFLCSYNQFSKLKLNYKNLFSFVFLFSP